MGVHDGHRQRKRDQFLSHGLEAFSEHELLELLLYYAIPRKDTNPIAHELIDRFGGLMEVLTAPVEELVQVPDIGENAAALIKLVIPLYRRARVLEAERTVILDTRERIAGFFQNLFLAYPTEVMYQLCLDAKGKKLGLFKVGDGDMASVGLNIRQIMENVLYSRASMVVLAHNHPSGVALPSEQDQLATRMVQDALGNMGVRLVDHIIVADNDYVSMAESGLL